MQLLNRAMNNLSLNPGSPRVMVPSAATQSFTSQILPVSAQRAPTLRMSVGLPENADLRRGRPDWSREWGMAKTGGPNHRRHEVRSGLIRAALQAQWDYAKATHQLDAFFDMANRVLQAECLPVTSEKDADLVIDRLYSRLHNNHMNIFYGRGSYNQMLGTLAHGLERFQESYFDSLDEKSDPQALKTGAADWLQNVLSYAMCEYMDFSPEQIQAIDGAVKLCLTTDPVVLDGEGLQKALDAIALFDPAQRDEGPMEFQAHRGRQAALIDGGQLAAAQLNAAFIAFEQGNPTATEVDAIGVLRQDLRDIALDFLDSADTDLSEAGEEPLRKLQNQRAIEVTTRLSALVTDPDLEAFEQTAQQFLSLESEGGALLGIGADYRKWFSDDRSRERFFNAITSAKMVPTVESARFNPRQWDAPIKRHFRASRHTQRVQLVPSTLLRQVGYSVSNYAVATQQTDKLMRVYERLLSRPTGSIQDVNTLQRAHADLIRKAHNNPTNIYIGSRAAQIARENMSFALETSQTLLTKALATDCTEGEFKDALQTWREKVLTTALQGYLTLTPLEERSVVASVGQVFSQERSSQSDQALEEQLLPTLKGNLELFSDSVRLTGPLARYDVHQLDALRAKVTQVIQLAKPLGIEIDEVLQDETAPVSTKQASIERIADRLAHKVTHAPSRAPDVDIRTEQNKLMRFIDPLLRLKSEKIHDTQADVLDRYEKTLSGFLRTAEVAQEWGLTDWATGAGAIQRQGPQSRK